METKLMVYEGRRETRDGLPLRICWSNMARMHPDLDLPDFLVRTPQGTWRIAGTRVSLDSVIHSFREGATPEEICQDFPSLSLPQVYETIAYYLKQQDKVDAYLQTGLDSAEKLRQELNTRHRDFLSKLRQQLLSSRQSPTPS
ncbi:MAG TPA: DUF433 domain-containing protein [Candidatus Binatia bacterium]|nr:DUF433 domain-containing protein [Candidatus Binatia bacterium]